MDNLQAHKTPRALEAMRRAGAEILFLPPYSPEFNPIERAWSKLKEFVRRTQTLTREAFERAVAAAMDAISLQDIRAWTAFAGYQVN
ncbi:MAG: transposase [Cyanobacteria bacterium REEB65]|nr:transposase [Cyanobacteria bacterium REEB65]